MRLLFHVWLGSKVLGEPGAPKAPVLADGATGAAAGGASFRAEGGDHTADLPFLRTCQGLRHLRASVPGGVLFLPSESKEEDIWGPGVVPREALRCPELPHS